MPISTTVRKAGPFIGNGSMTVLPFAFKVFAPADLRVLRTTIATAATPENTVTLTLGSQYTVSLNADQDLAPGGAVTLAGPLQAWQRVTIVSAVPQTQPVKLHGQGGFYPTTLNDALDRATALIQQMEDTLSRVPKLPATESAWPALPAASSRVTKLLAFDAFGAPTVAAPGDLPGLQGAPGPVGPPGPPGQPGASGASGIVARGAYNAGTAYVVNDLVTEGGQAYVCIAPSTGNLPSASPNFFALFVAAGATGPAGPPATPDTVRDALVDSTVHRWQRRTGPDRMQWQTKLASEPSDAWADVPGASILIADLLTGEQALPLSVVMGAVTGLLPTSFTLSMTVGGAVPSGSSMRIEWTDNVAAGPWRSSPIVPAVAGIYQHAFTGAPASTTLFRRGVVFSVVQAPPGSQTTGTIEVTHVTTDVQSFQTPAASGGPLTLVNGSPASITATGFTLSATVGGTVPAGSVMMLQWTDNPSAGPWRESPRTPAVVGVFSHVFTDAPPSTSITWRAFVFTDVTPAIIHAQTANATFSTSAGAASTGLLDTFISHMSANSVDNVVIVGAPPGSGWATGATRTKGADLRSAVQPDWWNNGSSMGNPRFDLDPAFWAQAIPWNWTWDLPDHTTGVNARLAFRDCEFWVYHDDTNAWSRLSVQATMEGSVYPKAQGPDAIRQPQPDGSFEFFHRVTGANMGVNLRTESDGSSSIRAVAGSIGNFHGYGAWASIPRPGAVRVIISRCRVRKVLHDPGGPDQRSQASYAFATGADTYPVAQGPGIFAPMGYNPGVGQSRWVRVTNDWQWVYMVTLSTAHIPNNSWASPSTVPPAPWGLPPNERLTITPAALSAIMPPF